MNADWQVLPEQVAQALASNPQAIYLDVRTESEFAADHPQGALNIPVVQKDAFGGMSENPDFLTIVETLFPIETVIYCVCQSGNRSQHAAQLLDQSGYQQVFNVIGGYCGGTDPRTGQPVKGWRESGLAVSSEVTDSNSYAALRRKARL